MGDDSLWVDAEVDDVVRETNELRLFAGPLHGSSTVHMSSPHLAPRGTHVSVDIRDNKDWHRGVVVDDYIDVHVRGAARRGRREWVVGRVTMRTYEIFWVRTVHGCFSRFVDGRSVAPLGSRAQGGLPILNTPWYDTLRHGNTIDVRLYDTDSGTVKWQTCRFMGYNEAQTHIRYLVANCEMGTVGKYGRNVAPAGMRTRFANVLTGEDEGEKSDTEEDVEHKVQRGEYMSIRNTVVGQWVDGFLHGKWTRMQLVERGAHVAFVKTREDGQKVFVWCYDDRRVAPAGRHTRARSL